MSRCDPRPCARAKLRLGKNKRAVAVAAGLLEHLTFQVAPCKAASVATRHQKEFTCSSLTTRSIASRFCGLPSAHTLTNSSQLEFRSPAASAPCRLHRKARTGRADGCHAGAALSPRTESRGALSCTGAAGSGGAQPARGSGVSRGQRSAAGRAPL